MRNTSVVLTFDYEIYFAGPSTVERCLIAPVDVLLRELNHVGAPACFFVDGTHLLRMSEETRAAEDLRRVGDQIGRIIAAGHRVELHIHPQWNDATLQDNGTWVFSGNRSCVLGDLKAELVRDMMVTSAEVLSRHTRAASTGYTLEAFRAPGLCAQPFHAIAVAMDELGLKIDSSVAAGLVRQTQFHSFDYSTAPRDNCWRFSSDPAIAEPDGQYIELPITTMRLSIGDKVRRRVDQARRPAAYRSFGDGSFLPSPNPLPARLVSSTSVLTLEATPPDMIRMALRAHDLVTFVSHPKAMSPISLETLAWLARQPTRFLTLAEAIQEECGEHGLA